MYIKRKKNRSGSVSVVVAEKHKGKYTELITIGVAKNQSEICFYEDKARDWINHERMRRQPQLDLFDERINECNAERLSVEQILSNITNISINGCDLILDRVFDKIGFDRIEDDIFRKLVKARLSLQIKLPINNEIINKTMLMKRHQRIASLFDDQFWGTR